jgi:hypothetical protein
MSQISLYLISVAISLLIGVGVSLFLRKSLFTLLVDICGTQERARFWLHLTILSYILVAAAIGLAFQPEITHVQGFTEFNDGVVHEERIYYEMADYDPMIYSFGGQLGKTVFGLLLTTGFMAITISRFIRRQDRNEPVQVQG